MLCSASSDSELEVEVMSGKVEYKRWPEMTAECVLG